MECDIAIKVRHSSAVLRSCLVRRITIVTSFLGQSRILLHFGSSSTPQMGLSIDVSKTEKNKHQVPGRRPKFKRKAALEPPQPKVMKAACTSILRVEALSRAR